MNGASQGKLNSDPVADTIKNIIVYRKGEKGKRKAAPKHKLKSKNGYHESGAKSNGRNERSHESKK